MRSLFDSDVTRLAATGLIGLGLLTAGCGTEGGDDDTVVATATPATPTPTATAIPPTPTPTPTATATPTAVPVGPAINIVSPRNNAPAVDLGADADLTVTVTTTITPPGFVLKDPGTCAAEDGENCGHIYLFIDGSDGNYDGNPYNSLSTSLQIDAFFAAVAEPVGTHTVSVSLRADDGSAFTFGGEPIEDEVTFTTSAPEPTLAIVAPLDGDTVAPTNNEDLSLAVTVQAGDVLLAPLPADGEADPCDGQPNCGRLFLYIDGDAGNYEGNDYNSVSAVPAMVANFAALDDPTGNHEITVALQDRAGNVINDADGNPLSDTITVNVELPEPSLLIALPQDGDTVRAGVDVEKKVTFTYQTDDFRVASAEACALVSVACGQVWANVDGDAGNRPTLDYNAISSSGNQIDVAFGLLGDDTFGEHEVRLSLHDSDGNAVMDLDGNPVEQTVTVNVIDSTDVTVNIITPQENADIASGTPSINVVYSVTGSFTIAVPNGQGTDDVAECEDAGNEDCGYIKVWLDGNEVVTSSTLNPIAVDTGSLADGSHTLTLQVYEHGGSAPITAQGNDVEDSISFNIVSVSQ